MKSVIEWLECSANRMPQKIAVIDEMEKITYQSLYRNTRVLATVLLSELKNREAVAIFAEKSVQTTCAMLAVALLGGHYSFFDTKHPRKRLLDMTLTFHPRIILTTQEHFKLAQETFESLGIPIFIIEVLLASTLIDEIGLVKRIEEQIDTDPLYVNFTSGSTGEPKGVTVCHRSVIDFISIFVKTFHLQEDEIFANQAPFDFDVSVKDIYSSLFIGGTLVLIPRIYFSQPVKLMDYLCDYQVTNLTWAVSAMCFVSMMNGFSYKIPKTVRRVMFSGEVMPVKQLKLWQEAIPNAMYVNLYGPTEITCNCTYHILDRTYESQDVIPIGKAFENERVFLLSEENKEITADDEVGEICVSGTAVTLGYYCRSDLTSNAFIQNPTNHLYQECIYRTGDIGKWKNGLLYYVSRKDFQIKHFGHRIELGEIETTVQTIENIDRSIVLYHQDKKIIVLFYLGNIEKKEVLVRLKNILPVYMVPNKIIKMNEFPITKNGKVDRQKLMSELK